ncbi:MAG: hypothetical protein DI547_08635 [Sphingobium sp.]|nr:MAG: hypothetical protein DI547_08635 [Sphingobium sp.]
MQLDDQLRHYFGTADLDALPEAALSAGLERMAVDFGLETDRARKFALWALMNAFGNAPDLDVAFDDPADREAARDLLDMADRTLDEDPSS